MTGEATPYYLFHPLVPERVRRQLPEVRIVVLLREPTARAWSHYQHEQRRGRERRTFEEAIAGERERVSLATEALRSGRVTRSAVHQNKSYVSRGFYAEQLARWLGCFPRSQLLVVTAEALWRAPETEYPRVLEHLRLRSIPAPPVTKRYAGSYKQAMAPQVKARLADLYRADREALESLLCQELGWEGDEAE